MSALNSSSTSVSEDVWRREGWEDEVSADCSRDEAELGRRRREKGRKVTGERGGGGVTAPCAHDA